MQPIKLTPTLRVNDFDDHQYTIERLVTYTKGERAGASVWMPVAYCGSVKGLADIAKRTMGDDAATDARRLVGLNFNDSELSLILSQLPPKRPKPKKTQDVA